MDETKQKSLNEWLVINSQLGDRSALDSLLSYWRPRLLTYAQRRLNDREQAQEVVQECLLGVTRGITRLRDPSAFPGWCYRLLERRCTDLIRVRVREREKLTELARQEQAGVVSDRYDEARSVEKSVSVEQGLARLDSNLAAVLKLFYQESFTIEEIATILGKPIGTVKSRLYYARKSLAAILEDTE